MVKMFKNKEKFSLHKAWDGSKEFVEQVWVSIVDRTIFGKILPLLEVIFLDNVLPIIFSILEFILGILFGILFPLLFEFILERIFDIHSFIKLKQENEFFDEKLDYIFRWYIEMHILVDKAIDNVESDIWIYMKDIVYLEDRKEELESQVAELHKCIEYLKSERDKYELNYTVPQDKSPESIE